MKKKLNKPDLQVKLIPITSQKPYSHCCKTALSILNVVSTTNNVERQKQAAFSDTIFVVGTRLLTKKAAISKILPT
ncbi:glutamate/aspartate periplasmic binding protein [Escherichia coli]|uniref:Glutamate/aspartate periplasmic binding protein n=1 Tax=Escherichia coli TaxID=562 RepID=A0A376YBQ1_ECOLX|nr:glutamate/aspartate periplasmic binding protein [Escherichia coli]